MFRNIDLYEGKSYGFTGKVIQALDGRGDSYQLRISVTKDRFNWSDTVFVFHDGIRILEEDIVQFVATVEGTITYESVLGGEITIPELKSNWLKVIDESDISNIAPIDDETAVATSPTSTPTSIALEVTEGSFGDGVWAVGKDIQPGTYVSDASNGCYWQRMSGLSGEFSEILANDNTDDPIVIEILTSDVGFSSTRCERWIMADEANPPDISDGFGDGVWRVGIDIEPGAYFSEASEGCYWQRTSGLSGDFSKLLANDNTDDPVVIEILPSDVGFSSTRCGQWTQAEETSPTDTSDGFGDGVWRVGIDIEPGIYFSEASEGCYWQRMSGLSGDFSELLANDNTDDRVVVEILDSDVGFSSTRCGSWVLGSGITPDLAADGFGDGVWRVGVDIQPGTYISEPSVGCYWQRTSGLSVDFSELLANDNTDDRVIVEILESDTGFSSTRCGDWKLSG